MKSKSANGLPFEKKYWDEVYGDGLDVDATFNAREHAAYLHSLFALMEIRVSSICDIGFGKAVLLKEFCRIFKPAKVLAVDPSLQMVGELVRKSWIKKYNIGVKNESVSEVRLNSFYSLTILNSVAQYIPDQDLKKLLRMLASSTRYVYFSAPTKSDYKRMKKELGFSDPYAYKRSKQDYIKMISPWFHFVSMNLLETKKKPGKFVDELFLF